jgi:hypothetical protein
MRIILYYFRPFMGDGMPRSYGARIHQAAFFYKYVAATPLGE